MEDLKITEFLRFYTTAIKAQKQTIEEAWIVYEKSPARESWDDEGGFKSFLIEYLDNELKAMYEKSGVEMPKL